MEIFGLPLIAVIVWLAVDAWSNVRDKHNLWLNVTIGTFTTVLAIGTFLILVWDIYVKFVPESMQVTGAAMFAVLAVLAIILPPFLKKGKKKAV